MRASNWLFFSFLIVGSTKAVSNRRQAEEIHDDHQYIESHPPLPLQLSLGPSAHELGRANSVDLNLKLSSSSAQQDRGKGPMTHSYDHGQQSEPQYLSGGSMQLNHEDERMDTTNWLSLANHASSSTTDGTSLTTTSNTEDQPLNAMDQLLQQVWQENGLGTHLSPEEFALRVNRIRDHRFTAKHLGKFVSLQLSKILGDTKEEKAYFKRYQLKTRELAYKKFHTNLYVKPKAEWNDQQRAQAVVDRMDYNMAIKANPKKHRETRIRKEKRREAEELRDNIAQVFEQHFWNKYGKDASELAVNLVEEEARQLELHGVKPKRFTMLLNQYLETKPNFDMLEYKWLRLQRSKRGANGSGSQTI